MNYYRFPEQKAFKPIFFVYLLLLQMVARSTMYSSTILGYYPAQIIMIALVGLGGIAFLFVNRRNLKQILTDSRMGMVLLFAAVILGPMVVKRDWQLLYITIFLYICVSVFFNYFMPFQELGKYYVLLMAFLGTYAVIGQFLLKPLVLAGVLPMIRFDSPGGWDMFNLGLTFAVDKNINSHDAMRVFGIFREPGLHQCFLFIAIHLNNYIVAWNRSWHRWLLNGLLYIALLTTFATGGVFALILYTVFLFFDKGFYKDKRMRVAAAAAVAAGVVAVMIALATGGTWAYELIGMVEKIFNRMDSFTARLKAISADAALFFAHPLFGAGLSEAMHAVYNNPTSSPIFFAAFGIFGGCVHVLSWVAMVWRKERHWIMNLILLVIVFIPFNTQNVIHDMFFWMFPVAALTEHCCRWLNENRRKTRNS